MNIPHPGLAAFRHAGRSSLRQRGSAVLIVLVLLACLAVIIMANSGTLHHFKEELKLLDRQQQEKYGPR